LIWEAKRHYFHDDNEAPIRDEPLSTTSTSSKEGKRDPFVGQLERHDLLLVSSMNESSTSMIASVAMHR
jgi:hypothetical protein